MDFDSSSYVLRLSSLPDQLVVNVYSLPFTTLVHPTEYFSRCVENLCFLSLLRSMVVDVVRYQTSLALLFFLLT